MKAKLSKRNSLLWGVIAVVLGLFIAFNPEQVSLLSIQIIGIILLVMGAVQLISFFATAKRNNLPWTAMPFGGAIIAIFGILLISTPAIFLEVFAIMLGAIVAFLGVLQIVTLVKLKKAGASVKALYYIFPITLTIMGIIIITYPFGSNNIIWIFTGCWITAFGLSEITSYFLIRIPEKTESTEEERKEE